MKIILKITLFFVLGLIVLMLLFSVIYPFFNPTSSLQIINFAGNNPNEYLNLKKPAASTTIYASNNEVIGKIYNSEEAAYQYLKNPAQYKGKSILYHLINIPPYSSNTNVLYLATQVKSYFLKLLKNNNVISKSNYTQAINNFDTPYFQVLHTPYFTEYTMNKLIANYDKYVISGGLKVYTTVSPQWNTIAQNIVTQDISQYIVPVGGSSAAFVADNPQTGAIIAMIGGGSYSQQQINMADVPEQQGSAMKPLIYIKAFEMGYSPKTLIDDAPVCYGSGPSAYCPTDYEGYTVGWVSIDRAINQSINIPAIKMLARIGYQNGLNTLESEGIKLNPKIFYGLPLVLGAAGIPVVRMVGAYNALNNGGYYAQSTPFQKITYNGKTIFDLSKVTHARILNANDVAEMDHVLGNTALKAPLYGPYTYYYSIQGRPYGSKDGTTNGPRGITDYEFIPQITVGVWAGNVNNSLMGQNAVGAFQTGPIAHSFIMDYIKQNNLPVVNYPSYTYPTLNSQTSTIP